jgi:hypothetical protein
MKQMQRKCSFIDWRERVEELHHKLQKDERITIDQIKSLLDEGVDKEFLVKQAQLYASVSQVEADETRPDSIVHMFAHFKDLGFITQTFKDAINFDNQLKKALKIIENNSQSNSSSASVLSGGDLQPEESTEYDTIEKLTELLDQEKHIKIEVMHLKEFKIKLKELCKAEERCNQLIEQHLNQEQGEFYIETKAEFDMLIKAMCEFENQNISCSSFKTFGEKMLPFIQWLNKASKLIKNYSRALGVKNT